MDHLGVAVSLDDLNGDGIADLMAGGPGKIWEEDEEADSEQGTLAWLMGPISGSILVSDADGALLGDPQDSLGYAFSMGDMDGDGYTVDEDCDDTDGSAYPGASEDISDGVDNDCDGDVDERFDTEVADSSCDCGYTSVVDVDSLGGVHVAYLNADTGELTYAKRGKSSWGSTSVIDGNSSNWAGLYVDGRIDNADQFQVAYSYGAYYDSSSGRTLGEYVAWGYRDSSGLWDAGYYVDGYVDSGDSYDVGNFVSMSHDSSNIPAFLYQDASGVSDIGAGFATPKIRTFQDFSLLSLDISSALDVTYLGDSGWFTDIAHDSNDILHLSLIHI